MTIHYVEQGSNEWHALRLGKVTASRVADVCRKLKSGGYSTERANYKAELILERLTGTRAAGFVSKDMEIGTLREPDARAEYELRRRCEVLQVGFVEHPTIAMTGASVDGFVGEDGFVEFKCPKPATHLGYLRAGVVPSDYMLQIIWNFACNPARQWCDFCSFNPDFPEQMSLLIVRIARDEVRIAETERAVCAFLAEVEQELAEIRATYIDRRNVLAEKLTSSLALLEAS
jgi:hypothetical protein